MTYATQKDVWLAGSRNSLETLAFRAESVLASAGWFARCVVGEGSDWLHLRVHALGDVPGELLCAVRLDLQDVLFAGVALEVTSWKTHPRAFFSVSPEPLPSGSWSNLLPGEACGTCGTREVRARRCGFCGARA